MNAFCNSVSLVINHISWSLVVSVKKKFYLTTSSSTFSWKATRPAYVPHGYELFAILDDSFSNINGKKPGKFKFTKQSYKRTSCRCVFISLLQSAMNLLARCDRNVSRNIIYHIKLFL